MERFGKIVNGFHPLTFFADDDNDDDDDDDNDDDDDELFLWYGLSTKSV